MNTIDQLRQIAIFYLDHWHTIDFISVLWIVVLFFLSILFVILIFEKMPIISFVMFFISISAAIFGFLYTKDYVDKMLRNREAVIVLDHKMNYSDALLVDVNLTNLSKSSFKHCSVNVKINKVESSFLKNLINSLKPIYKKTIVLEDHLEPNETRKLHFLFTNFTYDGKYEPKVKSECF